MADQKLTQLSAWPAGSGDGFADLLLAVLASGPTSYKLTPWQLLSDLKRKWSYIETDCCGNPAPWSQFANNGGATASNNPDADHIGVANHDTSSGATGNAGLAAVDNPLAYPMGPGNSYGQMRIRTILRTPGALSTGTQRYGLLTGIVDAGGTWQPSNCIGVSYRDDQNGGRWALVARNGGAQQLVDTGIAVATGTWYRIDIDINAGHSSVTCTINGTTSSSLTTGLPGFNGFHLAGIFKSVGTTARDFDLDYISIMRMTGSTGR